MSAVKHANASVTLTDKGYKMEELKLLIEMVAHLPAMALWVLVGFWAYKVICIGSIYGVIRLTITKAHDYFTQPPKPEYKDIRPILDRICIGGQLEPLIDQIKRCTGKGTNIQSEYYHSKSVEWLRSAIDDKIEKDRLEQKTRMQA